jgi:hypothetical protein
MFHVRFLWIRSCSYSGCNGWPLLADHISFNQSMPSISSGCWPKESFNIQYLGLHIFPLICLYFQYLLEWGFFFAFSGMILPVFNLMCLHVFFTTCIHRGLYVKSLLQTRPLTTCSRPIRNLSTSLQCCLSFLIHPLPYTLYDDFSFPILYTSLPSCLGKYRAYPVPNITP